jgi:hypothetical protein
MNPLKMANMVETYTKDSCYSADLFDGTDVRLLNTKYKVKLSLCLTN